MANSITTRIKLPDDVHRQVKAAAVLCDVRTDEALGMCVAYLVASVRPLSWLPNYPAPCGENQEEGE
uniref:Uncharacterized protein n=1 Tax=viral metagenome TaxID=1070528 RepID=A0A6H1ZWI1_9ZZZZ